MINVMTSHPVPQPDLTQYPTKQKRWSKVRRQTSKDTKPPNSAQCGLSATTSGDRQVPAVIDILLHKPSLQPDERKPAGGPRLEKDVEGVERRCVVTMREMLISLFQASDNKLAMKLFGNRNALMKERLRHRAANNWVIHPCSDFR